MARRQQRRSGVSYIDNLEPSSSNSQIMSHGGSFIRNSLVSSVLAVEDTSSLFRQTPSETQTHKNYRELVRRLLLSTPYTVAFILCVLLSIYGNDLRVLLDYPSLNSAFAVCFVILLGLFTLDIILHSVGTSGYFLSFSFLMDTIATLTILTDLTFLWESKSDCSVVVYVLKDVQSVTRLAARSHRVIEVLRLLRLMSIFKLYKRSSLLFSLHSTLDYRRKQQEILEERELKRRVKVFKYGSKLKTPNSTFRHDSTNVTKSRDSINHSTFSKLYSSNKAKSMSFHSETPEIPEESQVSLKLAELVIKVVYGTGLAILVAWPLFEVSLYQKIGNSESFGLKLLDDAYETGVNVEGFVSEYISQHTDERSLVPLIGLMGVNNFMYFTSGANPSDLFPCSKLTYTSAHFTATFDSSQETYLSTWLHILHIFFHSALLLTSTMLLFYDYSVNIFIGLERLLSFVRKISVNPMILLSEKTSYLIPSKFVGCCCYANSRDYGKHEMKRLEDSIYKIGIMLVLGFGTAGCEIITRNVNDIGNFNPIIAGKKVFAAFAFVSIDSFGRLATILQGDIMQYVNTISLFVHSVCEKYQGTVNRNLGDSFLMVWKFQEDDLIKTGAKVCSNALSQSTRLQAAFALLSAVRICVKVARASAMLKYHDDHRISSVMPYFSNKLTAGLHIGWGVEGPIGSIFKIDATYVSPDVNIAARLESATKMYGVLILASDIFVRHLDEQIQTYMRHVDSVRFKGSKEAINIYSFDISLRNLGVSIRIPKKQQTDEKRQKVREAFEYNYFSIQLLFSKSKKLQLMREMHTAGFRADYDQALRLYQAKDWHGACHILHTRCLHHLPTDGPSNSLLRYMEGQRFIPPLDWDGVRMLQSK